jgi:hypothetical protein
MSQGEDKPSVGYQILALLIPIAGIIMYFKQKENYPNKAKRYIQLASIGIALGVVSRFVTGM